MGTGERVCDDPERSDPLADPDGDGIVNLLECAYGMSPLHAEQSGQPVISKIEDRFLTLTYRKILTFHDLDYEVQRSTDMTDWSTGGITKRILYDDGGTQLIEASIPIGDDPTQFLRLNVTLLQP